jgi:hydroxyacylglutathione hydrolase
MFHRVFDEGLAQASYVVACDRTRQAAVIDPRRDVDVYLELARAHGLTIVAAIETHIHADFVSGARELGSGGARIYAGPQSDLRFDFHEVRDGERLPIGDIVHQFLHTPGHTPEHVCVLATEPGLPVRAFTGDTLFVGAVGRPDLLGPEQMQQLAGELYDSLTQKVLRLDDSVEVHPGHGAGSLCGAHIGSDAFSTIGRERSTNPLLAQRSREAFAAAVLADLPETPPYFARMKRINRDGPVLLGLSEWRGPGAISAVDAYAATEDGAILIDLRSADDFCRSHPAGALNLGFGARVGYWAGWVVPPGARLVLLASSPAEAAEAARQLMRVGLEGIVGYVDGGAGAWRSAGLPESSIERVTPRELRGRQEHGRELVTIVDVRTREEWSTGHIDGSVNLPVGELIGRVADAQPDTTVATICESGYRSTLAASILERAGLEHVICIKGGMAEFRRLGS